MAMNRTNFLISFAAAVAAAETLFTVGTNLFVQAPVETDAMKTAGYAALHIWGGPPPSQLRPVPTVSVQLMAAAKSQTTADALAQAFYEALFVNEDGELGAAGGGAVRNNWAIAGKKLVNRVVVADSDVPAGWIVHLVAPAGAPGVVGRDAERGVWNVAFNFDVTFNLNQVGS